MLIKHYQVKSELGTGGMATVYAAHDPKIGRDVAIKLMPQKREDEFSFRARFEREARTIAGLEHVAVVPVYEFGEDRGRPFLVMRLMTGGSLENRLRHGPMPLTEISKILRRIGGALDKAHANQIVHRDIKPANILFDDEGEPYLSDFGIVKVSGAETLTATGGVIGTPAYMSPEQVQGQSDVDSRADIYSLGALLFQMLSGRLPYESETVMGMALMHITSPVPTLQDVDPSLPLAYQEIISRAMAKERDHRFQTAKELVATFEYAARADSKHFEASAKATIVESSPYQTLSNDYGRRHQTDIAGTSGAASVQGESGSRRWLVMPAILLIVIASVAGILWFTGSMTTPRPTPAITMTSVKFVAAVTELSPATVELVETALPEEMLVINTETSLLETTIPATSSPTSTLEPIATELPLLREFSIGISSRGRPLELIQVGSGPHNLLLIGAMRGDQPSTPRLVQQVADYFEANPDLIPETHTVFFLPALNPDALAIDSRYTPGGVDLNRNWQTSSWVSDAPQPGGIKAGSGGVRPFSEPETDALQTWLLDLRSDPRTESVRVINYYHHAGVDDSGTVQPGYINYGQPETTSSDLARILSNSVGYIYTPAWQGSYVPTGEFLNWSATQGIASVDVELPPSRSGQGYTSQQLNMIADDIIQSIFSVFGE